MLLPQAGVSYLNHGKDDKGKGNDADLQIVWDLSIIIPLLHYTINRIPCQFLFVIASMKTQQQKHILGYNFQEGFKS